jgi:hypothetical protein
MVLLIAAVNIALHKISIMVSAFVVATWTSARDAGLLVAAIEKSDNGEAPRWELDTWDDSDFAIFIVESCSWLIRC